MDTARTFHEVSWTTHTPDKTRKKSGNCTVVTQSGFELLTSCNDRTYEDKMKRPVCLFGRLNNTFQKSNNTNIINFQSR